MKFECEIDMENAAFAHNLHYELAKLIKKIASEVNDFAYSERTKAVWDTNGNKIGAWKITLGGE